MRTCGRRVTSAMGRAATWNALSSVGRSPRVMSILSQLRHRGDRVVGRVLVLIGLLSLVGPGGAAQSQPDRRLSSSVSVESRTSLGIEPVVGRAHLRGVRDTGTSSSPSVGRIFLGSTAGVGVGAMVGAFVFTIAGELDFGDRRSGRRNPPGAEAAGALFVIGAGAIVAGGPLGAVEIGGVERRRRDAYVMATVGEVLVGGAGYGAATGLNGSLETRLTALGPAWPWGCAGRGTRRASPGRPGTRPLRKRPVEPRRSNRSRLASGGRGAFLVGGGHADDGALLARLSGGRPLYPGRSASGKGFLQSGRLGDGHSKPWRNGARDRLRPKFHEHPPAPRR
jgi:hypothetical protein